MAKRMSAAQQVKILANHITKMQTYIDSIDSQSTENQKQIMHEREELVQLRNYVKLLEDEVAYKSQPFLSKLFGLANKEDDFALDRRMMSLNDYAREKVLDYMEEYYNMNKIDWKGKLSSRKFWAMAATVATSAMVLFGIDAEMQVQIVALIASVGAAAAYIFGESKIDSAKAMGYAQGKAIAEELQLDHIPSEEEIASAYNAEQPANEVDTPETIPDEENPDRGR